jgi:hypothetical protein
MANEGEEGIGRCSPLGEVVNNPLGGQADAEQVAKIRVYEIPIQLSRIPKLEMKEKYGYR